MGTKQFVPFEACGRAIRTKRTAEDPSGWLVAEITPIVSNGSDLAQLFAAAPDMLGACRSALRALKDNLDPGCMDADAIGGLEAAIASATGEPA